MSSNKDSTSAIEQLQNSTAGVLVREQLHSWLRSKQLHYSGWEESNCTASNCSFLQIIEDNWSRSDAFHWRQITALRIAWHFIFQCCAVWIEIAILLYCNIAIFLYCYIDLSYIAKLLYYLRFQTMEGNNGWGGWVTESVCWTKVNSQWSRLSLLLLLIIHSLGLMGVNS